MTNYRNDQLTNWSPPHIKPARAGVYKTNWGYAHWNGKRRGIGQTPLFSRKSTRATATQLKTSSGAARTSTPSRERVSE